ncbi:MAG: trigger factor [bacterium]|nr:trigger factor [bacterium]MBU1917898.1 trigger factor [bacterium]
MVTTKLKDISSTKKEITISVSKDKINEYRKKAYQKIGSKATVKGFRSGKIPTNILDAYYGPEIDYECLNFMITDTYIAALKEHDLTPMTEPKFNTDALKKNADYDYSVELEIKPKFDLKEYKGIKIKKQTATIKDEEIEAELKRLQESMAQLAPIEGDEALTKGHVATIDFLGKVDGKAFKGGTAKDYVFEYGVGQFLPDFEKNISGMKKGEKKTIEVTFPKDYFEKDLAAKKATFDVELKNLHTKTLPPIDDELAKDIGKENMEQVKEELKKSLEQKKENEFRNDYAEAVKKNLLKEHKFDVPDSLVEEEVKRSKQEKKDVVDRFKVELILDAIAKAESIQATQQDLEFRLLTLSQVYRQPVDQIKKLYQENNMMSSLAMQVIFDKTINFIIDQANFT